MNSGLIKRAYRLGYASGLKKWASAGSLSFKQIRRALNLAKPHLRMIDDDIPGLTSAGKQIVASRLRPSLRVFSSSPTNKNLAPHAFSDLSVRREMFPRYSIFKGSQKIDGSGGAAFSGFGSNYHISGTNVSGGGTGLYTHVAQDPRQALLYGNILNVWNAKNVPGALNGNLRFFDNLLAETHVSPDYTRAHGIYRVSPKSGNKAVQSAVAKDSTQVRGGLDRRRKLDTSRPDYLDTFGEYSQFGSSNNLGEAEGLIDISKHRPSRTFKVSGNSAIDITQLANFRRTLTAPEDINVLDAIVSALKV